MDACNAANYFGKRRACEETAEFPGGSSLGGPSPLTSDSQPGEATRSTNRSRKLRELRYRQAFCFSVPFYNSWEKNTRTSSSQPYQENRKVDCW